nr:hypothetical protein [Tanacetum cinerariifolium]
MDDEPMWAADRVVAPTPGFAITIPETANEYAIKGSKILHSIKGTVLEEEIFFEFNKFIAMTADENYDAECDTEEPPFEKITMLGSKVFKKLLLFRLRILRSIQLGSISGIRASVIKNGNKVLKRTVGISEETYEPTSAEEKLDRRNDMKARGTLLMALPNKDQLKFHSYQDAKLLMESIEKRYGGNKESKKRNKAELETISLDDLYNNLKIYEPELSGSSHTNQNLQNMTFVSSNSTSNTNEADTTASGISTAHTQDDLEQIDPDDLEEMDLHWEMAMLTIRARRFMKRTDRNLDTNGRRIGFDKSKVECFNCYKNGHFARECRVPKNQDNRGREYGRKTVPVENPTENALITQDGIGGSESEDKVLAEYTKNLEKAEKERDELKLTLEKLQNSSKSLNNLLASQVSDKSKAGLGYNEITPDSFDNSSEILEKQENGSDKGYHEVPSPFTGNYMPPKRDLRLIDEHFESVSVDVISNIAPSDVKTVKTIDVNQKVLTRSGKINIAGASVTTAARPVNTAGSKSLVTHPRPKSKAFQIGHSKDTRPNNNFLSHKNSIFNKKVNIVKVNASTARDRAVGNPQQKEYKEKGFFDSGCSRHMTENKCYLTDFEAYDGRFVSFGDGKGRISSEGIENQLDCKVKVIRCDNGTVFENSVMNQFCKDKGIKREYSVARTPQQNRVVERRNRTLIEAIRTMALVTKPHNKTPYELIRERPPLIDDRFIIYAALRSYVITLMLKILKAS